MIHPHMRANLDSEVLGILRKLDVVHSTVRTFTVQLGEFGGEGPDYTGEDRDLAQEDEYWLNAVLGDSWRYQ